MIGQVPWPTPVAPIPLAMYWLRTDRVQRSQASWQLRHPCCLLIRRSSSKWIRSGPLWKCSDFGGKKQICCANFAANTPRRWVALRRSNSKAARSERARTQKEIARDRRWYSPACLASGCVRLSSKSRSFWVHRRLVTPGLYTLVYGILPFGCERLTEIADM